MKKDHQKMICHDCKKFAWRRFIVKSKEYCEKCFDRLFNIP